MPQYITSTATLPEATRKTHILPFDLQGGPVFAFPNVPGGVVDFSTLTSDQADNLIAHGAKFIAPVPPPEKKVEKAPG